MFIEIPIGAKACLIWVDRAVFISIIYLKKKQYENYLFIIFYIKQKTIIKRYFQ